MDFFPGGAEDDFDELDEDGFFLGYDHDIDNQVSNLPKQPIVIEDYKELNVSTTCNPPGQKVKSNLMFSKMVSCPPVQKSDLH